MPESDEPQEPEKSGEEEIPEDISPEDLAREVTDGLEEEEEETPTDETSVQQDEDESSPPNEQNDEADEPAGESAEDSSSVPAEEEQPPSQPEVDEEEPGEDVSEAEKESGKKETSGEKEKSGEELKTEGGENEDEAEEAPQREEAGEDSSSAEESETEEDQPAGEETVAEETVEDGEEPGEEQSTEQLEAGATPEEDETDEERAPDESAEETGEESSRSEAEAVDEEEEVSPEELAREATASDETETVETTSPGDEEVPEEEREPSESEAEEVPPADEVEGEEKDEEVEKEVSGESETEPDTEEVPEEMEEAGTEVPSAEEEEGEEGSIKDILEEEATRAREEPPEGEAEDEEEKGEEELPGGYLTEDQLPEEEEFTVPPQVIKVSKYIGFFLLFLLVIYYLIMPGLEAFLTAKIRSSFAENSPQAARFYARAGLFLNGMLIKSPDEFQAAYLKYLEEADEYELFKKEYNALVEGAPGARTRQVYAQYLLHRGKWTELQQQSLELQQEHETRGIGFLFAGRAHLNLGNFSEAQKALGRARADRSGDPEVYRLERDIFLRQQQLKRAQDAAFALSELAQNNEEIRVNAHDFVQLGKIQEEMGKRSSAVEMFENAINLVSHQPEALSYLVRYYTVESRWERAANYLKGVGERKGYREVYPYDPLGWWAEAELEFNRDNHERAVVLVERALELEPRNREANRVLGLIYLDGFEEPNMALQHLERARELGLDRFEFLNQLARAYFESELYLEAIAVYQDLDERLAEENPAVWYNIGTCYLGARRLDEAEKYLDRAYEQGYREAEIYNQRGLLYELRGQLQRAYGMYWEGIEILEEDGKDVTLIRKNLDRSFAAEAPSPLADWIGSIEEELK
ncbi:MAG: tetratricopeptide repeat protein [bacterium]